MPASSGRWWLSGCQYLSVLAAGVASVFRRCCWAVVDDGVPFDTANPGSTPPCLPYAWVFGDRVWCPPYWLFNRCRCTRLLLSVCRFWRLPCQLFGRCRCTVLLLLVRLVWRSALPPLPPVLVAVLRMLRDSILAPEHDFLHQQFRSIAT